MPRGPERYHVSGFSTISPVPYPRTFTECSAKGKREGGGGEERVQVGVREDKCMCVYVCETE